MKNMEMKEISEYPEDKVSDIIADDTLTDEIHKSSVTNTADSAEISKLVSDTCDTVEIFINDKTSTAEIHKSSTKEITISEEVSKLVSDSSDLARIIINDDSSRAEIHKSSAKEKAVSEEISKLFSDTCDTVQIDINDDSSTAVIHKPSAKDIAVSEEISKLVSDTCDTVQIIVNDETSNAFGDNVDLELSTAPKESEETCGISKTTNDDLYDDEMEDDDYETSNVLASCNNDSFSNQEVKSDSDLADCDKNSEMNEEDEDCTSPFLERDVRDSVRKERHWTERASLPYYREPKPDFFEYTRKLREELDPKTSNIGPNSSHGTIVLDEPFEPISQESDIIKPSITSGAYRNKSSTKIDLSLKKNNGKPSDKPVSGLIILDDYKSPKVKNSHFSRSSDIWNVSNLTSTKEKPEPVPGSKYKALKEQLMEKIMLKKEASFNKRKEEQEVDEENFAEEEDVSDASPYESDNSLSDDNLEDDSPEKAEDDIVLKDMLLKECETFQDNISAETEEMTVLEDEKKTKNFNLDVDISDDSQEPMECYSLPSYQPGGGFSSSPFQKKSIKRIFSNDSDFNDSTMNSPSQQRSSGRIFSDSDFIDSAPMESSGPSQSKKSSSGESKRKDGDLFESSNEIIPHWESLPVSERPGSQIFDEDISVICSGKFPSTNEDIPWTPSSSVQNSLQRKELATSPSYSNPLNNEADQLNESDDEELIRPAKKIKLSLVEKLWDSEDEDDADSKDPTIQNVKVKGNSCVVESDSDDDVDHEPDDDVDQEPDDDFEEDELDDQSKFLKKNAEDSFTESLVKIADEEETTNKFEIKNFFENEAELSGEEGSSDENEDDADDYIDDEMITDEIVASDEKLRNEVGTIHFKRQQDEDDQIIRQIKNDFLPEGELYNENGQRKRRYIWSNMGMDNNDFTETKSDSEEEEIESLPTDYLKWQQEKNKSDLPEEDDVELVQTPKSISLKVDIVGKVSVTRCSGISNSSISASPMLRRGSFLNSSLGKNMKFMKEFSSSEGSVSRKNFVFSSPQTNTSLPSTPASLMKNTKNNNSFCNRSIFNKI